MPFSYIEIEQEKKWIIGLLFLILVLFYFLTAWVLGSTFKFLIYIRLYPNIAHPYLGLKEIIGVLGTALFAGILHWCIFLKDAASKMLKALNAQPIDEKDLYHQRLRNIVEEVRVATGGQEVRCVVIPSVSMNAFAIMDFKERPVIGVTEGLLAKLKRRQLEAVVAHEMAHIVSGDCLMKTISCALFGLYSEILKGMREMSKEINGRGGDKTSGEALLLFFLVYIFLSICQGMASIMKMAISREREYRADAIAVRLTRNPLALAEVLYTISRNYRRTKGGEGLSPIFILSTRESKITEEESIWANLFSTHPPLRKRLKILLDMAHSDLEILEEEAKRTELKRDTVVTLTQPAAPKEAWFVNDEEGKWLGPFPLSELFQLKWLQPDTWVRQEGETKISLAYENKKLREMFRGNLKEESISKFLCPHCRIELIEILYEGTPLWQCNFCEGVRVEKPKITRILSRRDQGFSDEIAWLASFYDPTLRKRDGVKRVDQVGAKSLLDCPSCNGKMERRFYSLAYPIEIDSCKCCNYMWFGKSKLEILQYLVETTRTE